MNMDLDLDDEHPFFLSFERKLLKIKSLGLDGLDTLDTAYQDNCNRHKILLSWFQFQYTGVKLKCMLLFVAVSSIHNYGQRF